MRKTVNLTYQMGNNRINALPILEGKKGCLVNDARKKKREQSSYQMQDAFSRGVAEVESVEIASSDCGCREPVRAVRHARRVPAG